MNSWSNPVFSASLRKGSFFKPMFWFEFPHCPALLISFCAWLVFAGNCSAQQSSPLAPSKKLIETVRLAENGIPLLPVVVSPEASPAIRKVAGDLAAHLGLMAGCTFNVIEGKGESGIVLGTLAQFPDPSLASALAIKDNADGREAFAVRTAPGLVRLIGATDLGASHAAYNLLHSFGCRWFFPAPEWTVVPKRPTFSATLYLTDRPAILSRRIWWGYGFFDRERKQCQEDYEAWCRRNLMAQSVQISCGHAWQSIIADNRAVFDEHPEYLALVKGSRQGPQLCLSNPDLRALAVGWALDRFRRNPNADMVSMDPSDGAGQCECDACQKMGGISDRVFGLANEAARAVAAEFPGKMIGLYAYNEHCEPPSFALEPNVYVQSTAGFIRGRYTFDELKKLWPKHCKNMGFYEYFSVWLWDFDMPPGGRGADVAGIRKRIREYAALGATSLDAESGNNWGVHGRGYYVAARLMWNPDADMEAILSDFYSAAFGPAAATMRRYYERLDPGADPLISKHLLALALRDLDEASKQAAERPDVLARLDHLKQYQHYVRLRWEFDREKEQDRKKLLALQALTHLYRTRYSYMNHWEAARQSWLPQLIKTFDEPAWAESSSNTPPWKMEEKLTPAETAGLFEEDMAFFQPLPEPPEEARFSNDLAPSGLASQAQPAESLQSFQGSASYALWSGDGKPIELAVTTGVIAWYRDRPDAVWTFSDETGRELASGRLPQDGNEHALSLAVPRPGAYRFAFNDQAAGWRMRAPAGQPCSLLLAGAAAPSHMGHMQRMYFFVPKGTRRVSYFWKGGPHRVHGPGGEIRKEVESNGDYVSIDVPEGDDGKPWSFTRLALGRLRFCNVPAMLAASPEALMLPREAIRQDKGAR